MLEVTEIVISLLGLERSFPEFEAGEIGNMSKLVLGLYVLMQFLSFLIMFQGRDVVYLLLCYSFHFVSVTS